MWVQSFEPRDNTANPDSSAICQGKFRSRFVSLRFSVESRLEFFHVDLTMKRTSETFSSDEV